MQELRLVLIVVGALAIAALLFHGLWTSKKEGKAKFGNKPLEKLDVEQEEIEPQPQDFSHEPEDDVEIIHKARKEPDFDSDNIFEHKLVADPLIDDVLVAKDKIEPEEPASAFIARKVADEVETPVKEHIEPVFELNDITPDLVEEAQPQVSTEQPANAPQAEPEMQVIVLNVHCSGEEPFIGTKLFDSLKQNGLIYGEMDIFHRHVDLSGNGKVLFSVANMMHPGTLAHTDPAKFSTKGISFFMTLPCYGEADQNFNLMLRIAQQVADDMGGNVLDEKRNLITPDRIKAYRRQIVEFNATNA